ncbi:hypothetical protein G7Y89_g3345 [Cudoniella acicularis]|uniref:Cupin type-1 domain-containing protein n=1 Tax=Cudoniella acicularis TaxID=354080 RepID=A0A8H4RRJ8_9HELO|nr:hypothetical protein G7Y89_g3345 [Cudoniella acicularis]
MDSLSLYPTSSRPQSTGQNPLPQLLQTPSGLALLELQGTINLPDQADPFEDGSENQEKQTPIGRLIFPDYNSQDPSSTAWMKRVYMYVGKHQRLSGEVKKLPKAIAVIRKRTDGVQEPGAAGNSPSGEQRDDLEIVEIVKYKIMFSLRPEPWESRITPLSYGQELITTPPRDAQLYRKAIQTYAHAMHSVIYPPEQYYIKRSTPHVPNSPLPVLVYRSVLLSNPDPASTCAAIEPNDWLKGGVFKHYGAHHFHSVTHECYAVFKGHSRLLLGRGPLDPEDDHDLLLDLKEGDAIVLPAGVAHCNLESSDDYEYVGLYPKGSPHWDNNFCKADGEETREKEANARAVPIPQSDPIFGVGGPLVTIWKKAVA